MSLLFLTSFNTVVSRANNRSTVCFINSIKIFVGGFFFKNTSQGLSRSEYFNVILVLVTCCIKAVYCKLLLLVWFTSTEGMCDSLFSVPNTSPNFE